MMEQPLLQKYDVIDEKYTVQFFIKRGSHAESYRVKDALGTTLFLKLFQLEKLHRTQFDTEGEIKEINFLKDLNHENLVNYVDSGEWFRDNKRFAYLVLKFIPGETVAQLMKRESSLDWSQVYSITKGVLQGLSYLHTVERPIVHNDINNQNVMIDLGGTTPNPKIIDFGYARHFHNSTKVYYREGLMPYYLAPECFNNLFSPQSDLYAVGVMMYHMLFGIPPWYIDLSEYKKGSSFDFEEAIIAARNRPLKEPVVLSQRPVILDGLDVDVMGIIKKALQVDLDDRFSTAEEMIQALDGQFDVTEPIAKSENQKVIERKKSKEGSGFEGIAGMDELKEMLYRDVIRALENPELYESYGLTIPNGMLLWGPPGCGKSFFAEKLAEEVGYNYVVVKPSTLASIYVHGSQEKIGKLFDEARENAPTIINFEEFDALVPKRDGRASSSQSGEVNEFLTQLNNCGEDGVFVIASTNQPNLIDDAVLRSGRIDKRFFIPPPDLEARKAMLKLHLAKRPTDFGIDYEVLAAQTEHYVSVDVKAVVNEAARIALTKESKIDMDCMTEAIRSFTPSVRLSELQKYEELRRQMDSDGGPSAGRPESIGFKFPPKNE